MNIDAKSWHAKAFIWWYRQNHWGSTPKEANLCPYVRTILFWAPLRFIFLSYKPIWIPAWSLLGLAVEAVAYHFAGMKSIWGQLVAIGVFVAAGLIVALLFVMIKATTTLKQQESVKSFVAVLEARAEAFHNRICPIVKFE